MSETKAVKSIRVDHIVTATGEYTILEMPTEAYDAMVKNVRLSLLEEIEKEVETIKGKQCGDYDKIEGAYRLGAFQACGSILAVIRKKKEALK